MNNRKTAIISIWDIDNYGNRLQNYAMQSAVSRMGYRPYTIKCWHYSKLKKLVQYLLNYDVSLILLWKLYLTGNLRKYYFVSFERKNICKDRRFYNCMEDRKVLNKRYQKFIVGSDQVWHPVFLNEDHYYLRFVNEKKNSIAYAPSMGVSDMKEKDREKFKNGLSNFSYLSVREHKAAELIEQITGSKVGVVLDPTMLVEKETWELLEKKPKKMKHDYMLLYYLGDISKNRWKELQEIAERNHLDIVVMGRPDFPDYYATGPAQFLYLIHHAKLMCTDSFHGCVFSILYQTPFYVFEREDNLVNMNSRIDTLLNTFEFKDRYYKDMEQVSLQCDFNKSMVILEEKKKEAFLYLEKALKGE